MKIRGVKRTICFAFLFLMVFFYAVPVNALEADTNVEVTNDETDSLIEKFMKRMYRIILQREYDEKGLAEWVAQLENGAVDGAAVAEDFVFSEEFLSLKLSNEEFLFRMYGAFLDREPDKEGFEAWLCYLNNGVSRKYVCRGFVESEEFQRICDEYGIVRGTMKLSDEQRICDEYKIVRGTTKLSDDVCEDSYVTEYLYRCFTDIFACDPEEEELNYWVDQICNGNESVLDVIKQWIQSQEFKERELGDEEFVKILYDVFFLQNEYRKEYCEEELDYWIEELESGKKDRESILQQFTEKIPNQALGVNTVAYVFVGDSRFLGMDEVCHIEEQSERYFVICEGATGYSWFVEHAIPEIENLKRQHPDIRCWCIISGMGINDMENIDRYMETYEELRKEGYVLYLVSVNPIEEGSTVFFDKDVRAFNQKLKTMQNVIYIDCHSYLKKIGFATLDKLHYTDESYWDIFNFLRSYLAF